MAKTSPTQRSLKLMRDEGWTCCVVEKWNPHARIRQDAFGFGDILFCADTPSVGLAVGLLQTTTASHVQLRVDKILALPAAKTWVQAGGEILVHGWAKKGPRGKRKVWTVNTRQITLEDFA